MRRLIVAFLPLLVGLGCEGAPVTMDQLKVPQGFRYDMSQMVKMDLALVDAQGSPLANRMVRAYGPLQDGKHLFFQTKTDANGQVGTTLRIPAYWTSVLVAADEAAAPQEVTIASGRVSARIALAN